MLKKVLLYIMALAYIAAGINHFRNPAMYLKIIPPYLPWHDGINIISGVAEIFLGLLLFPKQTRSIAAWGLVVLLILIFPANIQMAIDYTAQAHPQKWLSYARLPLQPLLIWWAVTYTDWYRLRKTKESATITSPN